MDQPNQLLKEITQTIAQHLAQTHNLLHYTNGTNAYIERPGNPQDFIQMGNTPAGEITAYYYTKTDNYYKEVIKHPHDPELIPELERVTQEWINQTQQRYSSTTTNKPTTSSKTANRSNHKTTTKG